MSILLLRSMLLLTLSTPRFALPLPTDADSGLYRLDLAGTWQVRLDPNAMGEFERWYAATLGGETLRLPGTTDQAGLGHRLDPARMSYPVAMPWNVWPAGGLPERADKAGHLVRESMYIGKAWYQRQIVVPEEWSGRYVRLRLERTIWRSDVWMDNQSVGTDDSLVADHVFDLGILTPGSHRLTVRVDNGMQQPIGTLGHAYGPETQSRWNGIIGAIELLATSPVFVEEVQAYPAADRRSVRAVVVVRNTSKKTESRSVHVALSEKARRLAVGSVSRKIVAKPGRTSQAIELTLEEVARPWDEFQPHLYQLTATILPTEGTTERADHFVVPVGFRHLERTGRAIHLNKRPIFLRGTLDCCVYPRTGHPPMTSGAWQSIFLRLREHGFNHVRFHTWCPPKAAFEAADDLGMYLIPETPFWVDNWTNLLGSRPPLLGQSDNVLAYVRREIRRIQDTYGNHPSFSFFVIGNEFGDSSDWEQINDLLADAKRRDPRRLYNATTARRRVAADDFWITHRVGSAPARGVGPPHTNWDFSVAVRGVDLPIVAHETGQVPVFPDYAALLPKFTGPLKPFNLKRLATQLEASQLTNLRDDFTRASARFQFVQYKAEHEGVLRTPAMAGYQLLMFNDFTGQSEALVGIVDPFGDSKGVVAADEVRQWNAPTVPLARFERHTWTTDEVLAATLEVAHFGPEDLQEARTAWSLDTPAGEVLARGVLSPHRIATGGTTRLGDIEVPLAGFVTPAALTLRVTVGSHWNKWPLWVYPRAAAGPFPRGVLVVRTLDEESSRKLAEGGQVVVLAHGLRNERTARTGFRSVYWSAGWWGNRFSSLGILCNPSHAALAEFPNEGHSDWQWFELTEGATTFDLEDAPAGYRPIVQPVTDFHHNHLLGQVFEARVGKGRLLVCGYDLSTNLERRHAARQFRESLIQYVEGEAFQPSHEIPLPRVRQWLGAPLMVRLGARIHAADCEAAGYEAAKAINGRTDTFWHTPWTGNVSDFPHELVIDLQKPTSLRGVRVLARQDGNSGGRIKTYEVYVGNDGGQWNRAVRERQLANDMKRQAVLFEHVLTARFLRFVARSSHEDKAWASLAELEIIPAEVGN